MQLATRFASLVGGLRCRGCGRPHSMLCDGCAHESLAYRGGDAPGGVDRLLARWAYEGIPRELVLDLKLRATRAAAEPLARGVAQTVRAQGCRAEVLTWVPGRPRETKVRGFDHAGLIAQRLAGELGLPLAPLLVRRVDTADQTGLSRTARRLNLLGAFGSMPTSGWVGIVDDVVTSGATAQACAQALRSTGCRGVEVLAACRA